MNPLNLAIAGIIAATLLIVGYEATNEPATVSNTSYVAAIQSAQNIADAASTLYFAGDTNWPQDVNTAVTTTADPAVTYDAATQLLTFNAGDCWTVDMSGVGATPYTAEELPDYYDGGAVMGPRTLISRIYYRLRDWWWAAGCFVRGHHTWRYLDDDRRLCVMCDLYEAQCDVDGNR